MPTPHADGPDIAHYQTLTGKPVDPAWQLFSHKCSEGAFSGDAMFPARWAWMRAQGFKYRGAYHWLRSDSTVKVQAENLCRRLDALGGLHRGEFVQCDWETTPNITVPTSLMAQEWCDRVQQHFGRACVIMYSSDWLPDSTLDPDKVREFLEWRQENPDFPLWFANYNTGGGATGGWSECALYRADVWQWTSLFTHPSIAGRFDMNHVFAWSTLDRITDQVAAPAPLLPSEDDMTNILWRPRGYKNVFITNGVDSQAASDTMIVAQGLDPSKVTVDDHVPTLKSVLAHAGLDLDDLIPEPTET